MTEKQTDERQKMTEELKQQFAGKMVRSIDVVNSVQRTMEGTCQDFLWLEDDRIKMRFRDGRFVVFVADKLTEKSVSGRVSKKSPDTDKCRIDIIQNQRVSNPEGPALTETPKYRPFHETIVSAIKTSDDFETIAYLVEHTAIPTGHEKIMAALLDRWGQWEYWGTAVARLLEDLMKRRAEAEKITAAKAEEKRKQEDEKRKQEDEKRAQLEALRSHIEEMEKSLQIALRFF